MTIKELKAVAEFHRTFAQVNRDASVGEHDHEIKSNFLKEAATHQRWANELGAHAAAFETFRPMLTAPANTEAEELEKQKAWERKYGFDQPDNTPGDDAITS